MTEQQIFEIGVERYINRNGKKLKLQLTNKTKFGNYICNTRLDYVFQADKNDVDVINEGVINGKLNVRAVICDKCNNIASHDYNGTDFYLCDICYGKLTN